MSEKAKAETIERPTLKPGEVFAVVCKKCDFVKLRKNFSDARGWYRDHEKETGHHLVIEARKATEKPARAVKPAKVKKPEAAKRPRSKPDPAGAAEIAPKAASAAKAQS